MPTADAILDALDPEQRLVATTLTGPVVVLAGAGTGKTRAMTHRIAYASAIGRYQPTATLAVTFTTRAAGEMRSRLQSLGVRGVQTRTFHAAALRQAQYFWPRAYGSELPRIMENRFGLVAEAAGRNRIEVDTPALRDLVGEIGWAKVSNVTMERYADQARAHGREISSAEPEVVARVFDTYEELKRERGVIDFDDILLCTAALMAEREDVADEIRRAYRHFIVDEYQDVSPLQETLLRLWLGTRDDLCVVGDPAQTIHSFAGARSEYLTGFTRRYADATAITLDRDYRSTPEIIRVANDVMRRHRGAVSLRPVRATGARPRFVEHGNEADEAAGIASWLAELHQQGTPYRDMAVLFRINAQSPALEQALSARDVPYVVRGAERFYERTEVRQALAALHASVRREPESSDPLEAFRDVLQGIGWLPEAPTSAGAVREKWESLAALMAVAEDVVADAEEADAPIPGLSEIVAEIDLRAEAQHAPVANGVTLSTIHSAKGLEWEAVALSGIHEGTLPFVLATLPEQVEEERRLLYVGITRARSHLRVSWSRGRVGRGGNRRHSRFLDGIATSIEQVDCGARGGRRKGTVLSATCRVCGGRLNDATERSLGRHVDCESTYDEELLAALKEWRRQAATEAKLPAYCIFTDATLQAIAEQTPSDEQQLLRISGIGRAKLTAHGAAVLGILSQHR